MSIVNPGFSVPLGSVRDSKGTSVPLYISPVWQIFFQGLFERADGTDAIRIDALEEAAWVRDSEIDGVESLATQAVSEARSKSTLIEANSARLREIEFLGAFSWQ